jgi:hypothetical protein
MKREKAIEIAQAEAIAKSWQWIGKVEATCARKWLLFGPKQWSIRSNAQARGVNVYVLIDDASERILKSGFCPR